MTASEVEMQTLPQKINKYPLLRIAWVPKWRNEVDKFPCKPSDAPRVWPTLQNIRTCRTKGKEPKVKPLVLFVSICLYCLNLSLFVSIVLFVSVLFSLIPSDWSSSNAISVHTSVSSAPMAAKSFYSSKCLWSFIVFYLNVCLFLRFWEPGPFSIASEKPHLLVYRLINLHLQCLVHPTQG